jgi:AraC-like DNA-binding protein
MTGLPPGGGGWLSAVAGPQPGAALRLIREHPGTPWTAPRLAAPAGLPGSAFAARFTRLAGRAPLQDLTCWRMQRAQRLLRAGNAGIAQIAAQAGCQTGPAFSRAFRRRAGVAPGACRRGR